MKRIFVFIFFLMLSSQSSFLWALSDLYILSLPNFHPPEVVAAFEKEYGVKLRFEPFNSSEEMVARLNTDTKCDLLMPKGNALGMLIAGGKLAPLDHKKLPNLKNVNPQFLKNSSDAGLHYHIPYTVGNLGIIYRQDIIKNFEPSWDYIFDRDKNSVPFSLLDAYRVSTGAALLYLGYSYNSKNPMEIEKAMKLLEQTINRPTFMGFQTPEAVNKFLAEGFIDMAVTFNGNAATLLATDPRLEYVTPKEGSILWTNAYVINRESKNIELAHKWLNYLMDPVVAARVAEWTNETSPNAAAFLLMSPVTRQNYTIYPPDKIWTTTQVPRFLDDAEKIYLDYWQRLKRM